MATRQERRRLERQAQGAESLALRREATERKAQQLRERVAAFFGGAQAGER